MFKVGIDIIEATRIEKAIQRNERFTEKLFTAYEKNYINRKNRIMSAGGIFCAKEAVSKMLGTGISGFSWKDIEIKHDTHGKPLVFLYRKAEEAARLLKISEIEISISHSKENIVAVAVGRKNDFRQRLEKPLFSLPERKSDTHKGNYGKVGVIAGSFGMVGAAYMSSLACLRTGSGLVYSFVPEKVAEIMQIKSLENIVIPVKDFERGFFGRDSLTDITERLSDLDVLAIGPGIGRNIETGEFVAKCLKKSHCPVVIDADGIYHLKNFKEFKSMKKKNIVITPHVAELARFLRIDISEVLKNRIEYAVKTAKDYGITVVLKGKDTVVTDGEEIYVNKTGNPGMATAGSGDVLTGIITSLIGQGIEVFKAAKTGVYIHGLAGDKAAEKKSEYGMIASDIIEHIPDVLKEIVKC